MEIQNNQINSKVQQNKYNNFRGIACNIQHNTIQYKVKKRKRNKHVSRPNPHHLSQKSKFLKKKRNNGNWLPSENKKYFFFLTVNKKKFQINDQSKTQKIYEIMAKYIKTRSKSQCRNYHIKMLKRWINIQQILTYLFKLCKYPELNSINIDSEYMKTVVQINFLSSDQENQIQQNEFIFDIDNQQYESNSYYEMPRILQPQMVNKNSIKIFKIPITNFE